MVEIKYEIKNIALSASNQQNQKSKPLYKNKLRNMQDKHYKFRKEHRDNFFMTCHQTPELEIPHVLKNGDQMLYPARNYMLASSVLYD